MIAARPRPYGVVFPVVLIIGGLLILLANVGTLPEDTGWRLLQLWPLILVMLGIQFLVPHVVQGAAVPAVTILLVGVIALGGLAYGIAGPALSTGSYTRFQSTSPAAGQTSGTITVDAAGATIDITSSDIGTDLYQAKVDYMHGAPRFSYAHGDVHITSGSNNGFYWGGRPDVINVVVNPSVPWAIVINGAGTTTRVDMSAAALQSFKMNGVGGNVKLVAGRPDGIVNITVSGVGTGMDLEVPAGTDYRVTTSGIGTSVSGAAQTSGWAAAQNRYDVSVSGVGAHANVTVDGRA